LVQQLRAVMLPTIHIYSFGYKHSGVPEALAGRHLNGEGGGFVFDCRALPNPFWDEALRPFTGIEAPILEYMARCPEAQEFARAAAGMVLGAARSYRDQEKPTLHAGFGCTGGRHRSVWQAERLREALEREGFTVTVQHLDIHRPPDQPGAPPPNLRRGVADRT
jgi:UPF0042 nucleotide-binding protein